MGSNFQENPDVAYLADTSLFLATFSKGNIITKKTAPDKQTLPIGVRDNKARITPLTIAEIIRKYAI